MTRRGFLKTALLAAGAVLLGGHTAYGQWVVYRKKHLLIGCHKADLRTYELAKQVVAVLGQELPAAKARVARAPSAGRLASLLGTEQIEVVILSRADAAAMAGGSGEFRLYGQIPLRLILPLRDRVLVARADFPARHAWLVTGALAETDVAADPDLSGDASPGWHPGSLGFLTGEPEPTADP